MWIHIVLTCALLSSLFYHLLLPHFVCRRFGCRDKLSILLFILTSCFLCFRYAWSHLRRIYNHVLFCIVVALFAAFTGILLSVLAADYGSFLSASSTRWLWLKNVVFFTSWSFLAVYCYPVVRDAYIGFIIKFCWNKSQLIGTSHSLLWFRQWRRRKGDGITANIDFLLLSRNEFPPSQMTEHKAFRAAGQRFIWYMTTEASGVQI